MPKAAVRIVDESAIREHAYFLWENDGRPFGRDAEFWERARQEMTALMVPKATKAKAAASEAKPTKAGGKKPAAAAPKAEPKVVDAVAPRKVRAAAAKAEPATKVEKPARAKAKAATPKATKTAGMAKAKA